MSRSLNDGQVVVLTHGDTIPDRKYMSTAEGKILAADENFSEEG